MYHTHRDLRPSLLHPREASDSCPTAGWEFDESTLKAGPTAQNTVLSPKGSKYQCPTTVSLPAHTRRAFGTDDGTVGQIDKGHTVRQTSVSEHTHTHTHEYIVKWSTTNTNKISLAAGPGWAHQCDAQLRRSADIQSRCSADRQTSWDLVVDVGIAASVPVAAVANCQFLAQQDLDSTPSRNRVAFAQSPRT